MGNKFDHSHVKVIFTKTEFRQGYAFDTYTLINESQCPIRNVSVVLGYGSRVRDSVDHFPDHRTAFMKPMEEQPFTVSRNAKTEVKKDGWLIKGALGDGTNFITNGSSSLCFVTTAAYGNPDHPMVMVFRSLRDEVLNHNIPGKLFIGAYNIIGPKIAAKVEGKEAAMWFCRCFLTPLALTIKTIRNRPNSVAQKNKNDHQL